LVDDAFYRDRSTPMNREIWRRNAEGEDRDGSKIPEREEKEKKDPELGEFFQAMQRAHRPRRIRRKRSSLKREGRVEIARVDS